MWIFFYGSKNKSDLERIIGRIPKYHNVRLSNYIRIFIGSTQEENPVSRGSSPCSIVSVADKTVDGYIADLTDDEVKKIGKDHEGYREERHISENSYILSIIDVSQFKKKVRKHVTEALDASISEIRAFVKTAGTKNSSGFRAPTQDYLRKVCITIYDSRPPGYTGAPPRIDIFTYDWSRNSLEATGIPNYTCLLEGGMAKYLKYKKKYLNCFKKKMYE